MKKNIFIAVVLWSAMQVHADDEPFVLDAQHMQLNEKRFIPLDTPKSLGDSKNLVTEKKFYPLRSDRNQMQQGGMRIDRVRPKESAATGSSPQSTELSAEYDPKSSAAAVKVLSPETQDYERESDEITGLNESIDPVLALFDSEGGGSLTSFADAMRGTTSSMSVSGLVRHLTWPIPLDEKQYLSSGYGMRKDPFHGRPTFHGGMDIAAATGTPVLATADGVVVDAKTDMNYGRYITLEHRDGTLTRYGHLSALKVMEGKRVRAGEKIGEVGSTGRSTGAHLDYRVSKNGVKYDPLSILAVPLEIAMNDRVKTAAGGVAIHSRPKVASNALPRGPMVIKVR